MRAVAVGFVFCASLVHGRAGHSVWCHFTREGCAPTGLEPGGKARKPHRAPGWMSDVRWIACWFGLASCEKVSHEEVNHEEVYYAETGKMLKAIRDGVPTKLTDRPPSRTETVVDARGEEVSFVLLDRFMMATTGLLLYFAKTNDGHEQSRHDAPYVVKYFASCHKDDPLFDEYVFSRVVNELKKSTSMLTPEMIAISPPYIAKTFTQEGDYFPDDPLVPEFIVSEDAKCSAADYTARFIVETRIGPSVNDLMTVFFSPTSSSARISPFEPWEKSMIATIFFHQGMQLLQEIHQLGIVHGDIHPGNIALRDYVNSPAEILKDLLESDTKRVLVLIDFGKARFIPEIKKRKEEKMEKGMNLSLLSPWHLRGGPIGPRDDVFRLFELYLNMLSENCLADYYASTGTPLVAARPLAKIKANDNLVLHAKISEKYAQYFGPDLTLLTDLLHLVRPRRDPNYRAILAKTEEIRLLIRVTKKLMTTTSTAQN